MLFLWLAALAALILSLHHRNQLRELALREEKLADALEEVFARLGPRAAPRNEAEPATPPAANSAPPGGQPVAAQILWRGIGGTRTALPYRTELAKPKRAATPRQREAIDRALIARMRCPTCRLVRNYVIPRSLGECLSCAYPEDPQ